MSLSNLRYFLTVYLFVYVLVAFVWRSYIVWKHTGINPVTFKASDTTHDFIGRVFKLVFVVIVLVVFVYSFSPAAYTYTLPIQWLDNRWVRLIGVLLLLLSLAWTSVAQSQMGAAWRIGIDTEHRTPLVQKGTFRHLPQSHIPRDDPHAPGPVPDPSQRVHTACICLGSRIDRNPSAIGRGAPGPTTS